MPIKYKANNFLFELILSTFLPENRVDIVEEEDVVGDIVSIKQKCK